MSEFSGKVALITGAGRNIGRAIALDLASRGAAVAVNGRGDRAAVDAVVDEIRAAGGQAVAAMGDVSQPADVASIVAAAESLGDGVDFLISNAGLRRQTPITEMSYEEWREILSVALDGAFLLVRAVAPGMVARGRGGSIIAMSGVSHFIGTPGRAHVSASKAGLEGFVRSIARELGPHGIRCNCVAPGPIDTARGASAGGAPRSVSADELPLGRKGHVDEIAATVRFLLGDGGGFITGQTVHVNGGAYFS